MTEVLIPRKRLRELEVCAELAANLAQALGNGGGDLLVILLGAQEALAQYEARMALVQAMEE